MSGPLIELGPVTVETLPSLDDGVVRWRCSQQIVGVDLSGLVPLLTLPVHDGPLPSDKDVTVRPVTRREEG